MNVAIVLTGGTGSRMSAVIPKQFIKINDKPIFIYTLERIKEANIFSRVILVIHKDYEEKYKKYLNEFSFTSVELCYGGKLRQESSFNALEYLKKTGVNDEDIVLIHDGVRANVSTKILIDSVNGCNKKQNTMVTALPLTDTLADDFYQVLNRDTLHLIQTPQTFIFKQIYFFHHYAKDHQIQNRTDDAQLAKICNYPIYFVEGSKENIKITTQEDLNLFEYYLRKQV